ncbi:MAG: hypothetical protein M1828_005117 [Chrysothrix sp. TS-e1954]|nr:MAG: hypothetical protein M1828_005117 [Chrysothrix sp. TS-e1954]
MQKVESEERSGTGSHEDEREVITGWRLFLVGVSIVLSMFLASLDLTVIATAIPRITREFNSVNQVGWYASTLFLTVAAAQSPWGKAYKYFRIKWVYLASIVVFEVGSLICAVAQNSATFIAGRAITGLGVAGSFAGSYIIIGVSAPVKYRPALTGLVSGAYAIASAIGPLIGGALTDSLSWRWCFYINLPFGGAALACCILFLRIPQHIEPTPASVREKFLQMDLIGFFLFVGSMICFMLAMQWGGVDYAWNSSQVVGTLVGFGVLMIAFGINEWTQNERALLQRSRLMDRTFTVGCVFLFLIAGNFYILLYYLPIYFQAVKGTDAIESGIRNLPLILGTTLLQVAAGVLIGIVGLYNPFIILGSIITTIATGLLTLLSASSYHSAWIGYQTMVGIGLGLCFNVPIIVTQALTSQDQVAPAIAIMLFFQSFGGALIISAAQAIFQNTLITTLQSLDPGIDPGAVLATGATEIQKSFSPMELRSIDVAYMTGLRRAFYLAIAMAGLASLAAASQKWIWVNKKEASPVEKGASDDEKIED